jgi:hypothetical protein
MDPAGTRFGHRENHVVRRKVRKGLRFVLSTACGNLQKHYTTMVCPAPPGGGIIFREEDWEDVARGSLEGPT